MASFADPSDLVTYYDSRRVRELCSDTGTPISTGAVDSDPVLLAMLARATDMVLAAVRVGKRYSESELQTLAGSSTSGQMLTGLVCDLAFGSLVMRRGTGATDVDRLSPMYSTALRTLKLLEEGEWVFPRIDGEAHEDAGVPRCADLTQQPISNQCSWSSEATRRLVPKSPLNSTWGSNGCC